MQRRPRRTFDEDFKLKIVQLIESGKPRKEVINEYDLTTSALDNWIKQYRGSGSFKLVDNLTDSEKELIRAKKQIKDLEMEVDILKQAALIMGRK